MSSRHKASPEQNPWLLVGAFVLVGGLLFGLFRLVAPDDTMHARDAAGTPSATASEDPGDSGDGEAEHLADQVQGIQPGQVIRPIPGPRCRKVPKDLDITVLSYNIKSARIGGGLGAFLNIIRASGADVVLLQEVDMNRRGTRVNQPAWLADNLGSEWEWAFGKNVAYGSNAGYGTAILSRFPILSEANTHLPNGPGGQQRGLLKVVADVEGVDVSFYSTHLQNRIDYLKTRQAGAIVPIVADDPNPKVLAGDMNSHAGSAPIRLLEGPLDDTWAAVGAGGGFTHPSTHPRGRIDFQFYAGDELTPVRADVLGYTNSDHRAVRATYDVDGATVRSCSP